MQYRTLCGEEVSALGFGCMRLPIMDGKHDQIDAGTAIGLIHHALERGVNYLDSAWGYHGGNSEPLVGRAIEGIRDEVFIATKLPPWSVETLEDCERILDEQLKRLRTDHIDFYMLHSLIGPSWQRLHGLGVLGFLERALEDGRIRHAGFSFHDHVDCFKEIVDAWDWDFCQIQYNYMDERVQAGTEGMHYAAERGIGIVVMEPLRGGTLGEPLPEELEAKRQERGVEWSPAQLGLRWVFDQPEPAVTLSGMNRMDHLQENIAVAAATAPGAMTPEEHELIAGIQAHYREKMLVDCTACRYCMPCPQGVNIPRVFYLYNDMSMFNAQRARMGYQKMTNPDEWASHCVECGLCEERCPQNIPIIEKLAAAHEALTAED
ncbi:MAG: aldo/keto reductase [candidate division WS1 bacterium]|nr:aldo/keto reductase [candidate division WS1 bacterium]